MKAIVKVRVKSTGEIKEVTRGIYSPYQYVDKEGTIYTEDDVEELPGDDGVIFFDPTIDYWTRLEHQYAGMVMQGVISSKRCLDIKTDMYDIPHYSQILAHALVEKMKEERK
jgi:hypothetical protein